MPRPANNMASVVHDPIADLARKAKCKTACCCCIVSPCYCDCPDCIGCHCVSATGPCDDRCKCSLLHVSCSHDCFKSCSCCKCVQSCCCCLYACAFPTDDEVPCIIGLCGCMCKDVPIVNHQTTVVNLNHQTVQQYPANQNPVQQNFQAAPAPGTMMVQVPQGSSGGQQVTVQTSYGPQTYVVPEGLVPGNQFTISAQMPPGQQH